MSLLKKSFLNKVRREKSIDLGIIISDKNGLKEYKPSQIVIDTAKHYEYLRLVGYICPKEARRE